MKLSGLHFLLTYRCVLECDHCFTWGGPRQSGDMRMSDLHAYLEQARDVPSINSVCFEGGEPFLLYAILLQAVQEAAAMGYEVGIVTNAYWAVSEKRALAKLKPLAGLIQSITVSSDLFHSNEPLSPQVRHASAAAEALGIPIGVISIAQPDVQGARSSVGQLPDGGSKVMFRGRAADKLAPAQPAYPWDNYTCCPHEDLIEPGRIHLDPLGNLHICQGIVVGNVWQTPLKVLCDQYIPEQHPIVGPLLEGGPAELVRRYALDHRDCYADACHLCYSARLALRERFPLALAPDQMYGG